MGEGIAVEEFLFAVFNREGPSKVADYEMALTFTKYKNFC